MAIVALAFSVVYAVALYAVGERVLRRRSATRGWARSTGATEHTASLLVLVAWLLTLLGPALVLAEQLEPVGWLDGKVGHVIGVLMCCWSLGFAVASQRTMGPAWRTAIDPERPSDLIDTGVYHVVRNPVYTTMIALAFGLWLLVPTPAGALAVALCVAGLQMQTRLVEEPHLLSVHGEAYERYAGTVGRFLPEIGLVKSAEASERSPSSGGS